MTTPARGTTLLQSIIATFAAKMFGAILAVLTSVIVARSLGPEGRGSYSAALALAAIGMQFGSLGLQSSNIYYVARDKSLLPAIVANSIIAAAGFGGLAAAILAVFSWATGTVDQISPGLLILALLWVPFGLAYMLLSNLLIGLHAIAKFNQIEIGMKVATLLLTLAALFLRPPEASAVAAAGLAAQILALIAVWSRLGQRGSLIVARSLTLLQEHIPFAFRSYLASLFAFMLLRSDMLLVQHISGNAEAGQYSIAVAMADMIYILAVTAGSLLFPRLSANQDGVSRRKETKKTLVQIGLAMSALGLVAAVSASAVIALTFGPSYLPAASMFHILVFAIIAYGMNNILSNHLAAEGQPWSAVWVWVAALVVNLALNLIWIPGYGGRGAALASTVAYSLVLVFQAILIFRPRGGAQ